MSTSTIIIAEAGVNHNGDPGIARTLIEKAKECGADAVKFQLFKVASLVSEESPVADYQRNNTGETSQFDLLRKLELSEKDFSVLKTYAERLGIDFFLSPFDEESLVSISRMGIDTIKIPSGEITNLPFLKAIARQKKKVILSTGMSTMEEVEIAVEILLNEGVSSDHLCILQCTTEYPAPKNEINLLAMVEMGKKFGLKYGFSDHTEGYEVTLAAVALGASVIEKHFTLDKAMDGPDHRASLDPDEFTEMTRLIRNVEKALGNGVKKPSATELRNASIVRKSLFSSRLIQKDKEISVSDITFLRPGDGISPAELDRVIGKKARNLIPPGKKISWEDLE